MADININNLPEFDKPNNSGGITKWMWWLYTVVGLFVVCLLIWMFVALSKHQIVQQVEEPWTIENSQTAGPSHSSQN